jgi:hypothetical protein
MKKKMNLKTIIKKFDHGDRLETKDLKHAHSKLKSIEDLLSEIGYEKYNLVLNDVRDKRTIMENYLIERSETDLPF